MCLSTIDIKANKARCLELLRSTGREGMEDMIIELEKMGYFSMSSFQSLLPASVNEYQSLKSYIMGVIIFLVLCLNVIGYMCGGNSSWGE